MVKLDIGCGTKKKEGFVGIDKLKFDGVDIVRDVGVEPLPYEDNTVDEVHSSHFIEHLSATERIHFINELYRVMKPGAKATIIVPHFASGRAYGDPTHQWPPIGEFWFYYLKQDWRTANAPHTDIQHWAQGYRCDFDATWGYGIHPTLLTKNQEFQQFALNFYREAAQDIHATLVKRELPA
jgi:SAM-dependent methyltransferase